MRTLFASPNQVVGNGSGSINAQGLVSDYSLTFGTATVRP